MKGNPMRKLAALMFLYRQKLAAVMLLYAAYLTNKCPCARIMSCHKNEFFLLVGGATAIVVHDNKR